MEAIIIISIRQLLSTEREELRAHLLRLGSVQRKRRFAGTANDAFINRYVDRIDSRPSRHLVVGAFIGGRLRGAAELQRSDDTPHEAEIAFSVEEHFQYQGIGKSLFRQLITVARNRHIRRLRLTTEADNYAMQALAHKYGMRFNLAHDMEATLDLPPPATSSTAAEQVSEVRTWACGSPQTDQGVDSEICP